MRKKIAGAVLLLLIGGLFLFFFQRAKPDEVIVVPPPAAPSPLPSPSPADGVSEQLEKTKQEMMAQLNTTEAPNRTLAIPKARPRRPKKPPVFAPAETARVQGRKKRAGLPMGVVLRDRVFVTSAPGSKEKIFEMMTGDFVRVFPDGTETFYHVQPGLDIYLAATTKETRPAGEHLPDRDGWVKRTDLHLFEPEPAREFLMELDPITLGNDSSFSTLDFYDRAMKNPDPVVHRVIGPRLIALVMLHEDYSTSWSALYRDRDPKIRDAALAALRERGVGHSREVIEDLIARLAELTRVKAEGETELEVLAILSVLKQSGHPRVPAALQSFVEDWKGTQSGKINEVLTEILATK